MAAYSDEERDTVRSAAFGAVALVSKADPGFFAMFKESMAGSKAFTTASPELQELLKSGGMPNLPKGNSDEIDKSILSSVERAVAILQAKGARRGRRFQGGRRRRLQQGRRGVEGCRTRRDRGDRQGEERARRQLTRCTKSVGADGIEPPTAGV